MAKAFAEITCRRLDKHFYGNERLRWDSVKYVTVVCQRHGTTAGIKHMGTHNRSENGRGAWVAVCAHPTHTDRPLVPQNFAVFLYYMQGKLSDS
jgi:hypothetical protein